VGRRTRPDADDAVGIFQYAVDYDGDGKRNLIRSVPDVLARPRIISSGSAGSAASRGSPRCACRRTCRGIRPTSRSAAAREMGGFGVTLADGRPLPADNLPPRCCCRWGGSGRPSSSIRISRSICSGTTRWSIRPRPPIWPPALPARRRCIRGTPPPALAFNDVKDMQAMLARAGYDVGTVDGFWA
jgi:hypothetical protein